MRVLVFGDSITQGYWAVEHGWVDRLRQYFDDKQVNDLENNDEPTVFNLGVSADTSEDILKRLKSEIEARTRKHHESKPAIIVQVGVNDSSIDHGKKRIELKRYKENLQRIFDELKDMASVDIFVGFSACDESKTKPVFWGDYVYENREIKSYEYAMQDVALKNGISFIGVFNAFKKGLDSGADLLADGLHPNDAGHELIFNIVGPKAEELLR